MDRVTTNVRDAEVERETISGLTVVDLEPARDIVITPLALIEADSDEDCVILSLIEAVCEWEKEYCNDEDCDDVVVALSGFVRGVFEQLTVLVGVSLDVRLSEVEREVV